MASADPSPWLQFASGVLTYLAGVASAVFAEPLRQRIFRAEIALSFSGSSDCITRTQTVGAGLATYVRIKAACSKRRTARGCRAFLVGIETKSPAGIFTATDFVDSLPLAWSCSPQGEERKPRDLLWGISQYIDVVAAYDGSSYLAPQFDPVPNRYIPLFRFTEQIYRFTVLISGDGVKPSKIQLVVSWKGNASKMDVYEDGRA